MAIVRLATFVALAACDPQDSGPDSAIAMADATVTCQGPPGLFAPGNCDELAPGLQRFSPAFPLWTDGAAKERVIYLPPGSHIDSSDPNGWVFPVGTRLYKTFALDGVRLETRMLEKVGDGVGPANWEMRVFVWDSSQRTASETDGSVVPNVMGTDHDVPSHAMCVRCHSGARDAVNGFAAIQLGHTDGGLTVEVLSQSGRLVPALAGAVAVIPGDQITREALGYLHANCGHCHREGAPAATVTGLMFDVSTGLERPEASSTYLSAVNVPGAWVATGARFRVHPGDPDASTVIRRMSSREPAVQMPPIGTERLDEIGIAAVRAWITSM